VSLSGRLHDALTARMDARALAWVRIGVGSAAVLRVFEGWRVMARVLDPERVALPFCEALPRLPLEALPLFVGAWLAAALLFLVGWHTRLSGLALSLLIAYVLALDLQLYASHLYLMGLLCALLAIGGGGHALSLDARRRGPPAPGAIPKWPATLMKIQLSLVYGFAALAKLNPVYLSGAVLAVNLRRAGPLAVPGSLLEAPWLQALAVASIALEAFLALALWSRRWRRAALWAGPPFHAAMVLWIDPSLALQIGVFAIESLSLYVLFFAPPLPEIVADSPQFEA
jgi:hypothetical protein